MAPPGRNDPCPCGSGRRFKHCCERSGATPSTPGRASPGSFDDARPSRTAALHELDNSLTDRALVLGRRRFRDELDAAAAALPYDAEARDYLQLTIPYLVHAVEFDGQSLARHLVAHDRKRMDARELAWVEANALAPVSIWEVLTVEPEVALGLRDLLTGEERRVVERLATRSMRPRTAVCGRVVDGDGVSVLVGMHPRALGPFEADTVVRGVRRHLKTRAKRIASERLRWPASLAILRLWQDAVDALDRRPLPKMVNNEGDSLVLTDDAFSFAPSDRETLLERLSQLEGFEREPRAPDASEDEEHFHVTSDERPSHAMWDRTTLGRVTVKSDRVVVLTNSERRADALRQRVEAQCGALVAHVDRTARDAQDFVASSVGRPRKPAPPPPPEADAIVRQFKARHYAAWPDTAIPALGGLTPREAAAKPSTRARLDVLLRDLEMHESGQPESQRFDVSTLRRSLGVEG